MAFFYKSPSGAIRAPAPTGAVTFSASPLLALPTLAGFYGLLHQQQQIRNQEFNVRQLESVLEQFREFFLRERLDAVQLKLFESNVYGQQSALVQSKVNYQNSVDQFKQSIGLPPDLEVVIEDDFLDQFELISEQINDRLIAIDQLRKRTGEALNQIDDLLPSTPEATENFRWSEELRQTFSELTPALAKARQLLSAMRNDDLQQLDSDIKKLEQTRNDRIAYLKELTRAIEAGTIRSDVDPSLYQPDSVPNGAALRQLLSDPDNANSLTNRLTQLRTDLEQTTAVLNVLSEPQPDLMGAELADFIGERILEIVPGQLSELNNILLEMSLLQARARSNSIQIQAVDLDSQTATGIARQMRRRLDERPGRTGRQLAAD